MYRPDSSLVNAVLAVGGMLIAACWFIYSDKRVKRSKAKCKHALKKFKNDFNILIKDHTIIGFSKEKVDIYINKYNRLDGKINKLNISFWICNVIVIAIILVLMITGITYILFWDNENIRSIIMETILQIFTINDINIYGYMFWPFLISILIYPWANVLYIRLKISAFNWKILRDIVFPLFKSYVSRENVESSRLAYLNEQYKTLNKEIKKNIDCKNYKPRK